MASIKPTFEHDEVADVLYVTFGTGEPSFCREIDDVLIVEIGAYTKLPTGFRILDFSKRKRYEITFKCIKDKFNDIEQTAISHSRSEASEREKIFKEILEKELVFR